MSIQDLIQLINTQLPDNNQQLITEAILRGVLENMVNTLSSELRVFNINSSQVTDNGDGTYTITVTNPLDDALAIDEKLNIYEYNGTAWTLKFAGLGDFIATATDNGDYTYTFTSFDGNTTITIDLLNHSVDNIATLKTIQGIDGQFIEVLGYYTPNDGGGGSFYWDNNSTDADDAGSVIQVTGVATGRWKRIVVDGKYNIKQYGIKGDGSDEAVTINAALSNIPADSKVYFPSGTYSVDQPIHVNKTLTIEGDGFSTEFKIFTPEKELGLHEGIIKVNASYVVINGVRVNGNYTTSNYGSSNRNAGIYIEKGTSNVRVENCFAHNTSRQGLCILGVGHIIENINTYDTARHGISLGDGANQANVTSRVTLNNIFCTGQNMGGGVEINDGVHYCTLTNFRIDGTFGAGGIIIVDHGRPNESNSNIMITNGEILTNDVGCYVFGNGGNVASNITFSNINIETLGNGVYVRGISQNIILNNLNIKSGAASIDVTGEASGISISNIMLSKDVGGASITIDGSSSYTIKDILINNITYYGTPVTQRSRLSYTENAHISNILLLSDGSGTTFPWAIVDSQHIYMSNIIAHNPGNDGIMVNRSNDVIVENATVTNNNRFGIRIENSSNVKVLKSNVDGSANNGIYINNSKYVDIIDCVIQNGATTGIYFTLSIYFSIIGCRVLNQGVRGVRIDTGGLSINGIRIQNNSIFDDQTVPTQTTAIHYNEGTGSINDVIITNNILKGGFTGTAITPSPSVILNDNIT